MTPGVVAVHVIAVAWLVNGELTGAHTIPYPPTSFPSYEACMKSATAFAEVFKKEIGRRGVVVCVPR